MYQTNLEKKLLDTATKTVPDAAETASQKVVYRQLKQQEN